MRPKIYLFGDSITQESFSDGGWGTSLANHFWRTADLVLRGCSGYNTRWALKVIETLFPPASDAPMAVTVFFGANDACLPDGCCAYQHVPIDEYKQNLITIVAFFKKRWPATRILLITPPPVDEEARILYPYYDNPSGLSDRSNETTGTYAKQCVAAAAECGLAAIDLWSKMQEFPGWKKAYLWDGLHLTKEGNAVVFEEVMGWIKKEGISAESLPVDIPLISDIDPNDPLRSFDGY